MARTTRRSRLSSSLYRRSRREVLARSTVCHLCGRDGATTVDHLTPYSVGVRAGIPVSWLDSPANLLPAHNLCNARRGNKPLEGSPALAA